MSASDHVNRVAKETYERLKSAYPETRLGLSAYPNRLHLDVLIVPKEQRRQGVGSAIMQELTSTADREGLTMSVTPSTDFGGTKEGLHRFYRNFGFTPNKGRTRDFSTTASMLRPPK